MSEQDGDTGHESGRDGGEMQNNNNALPVSLPEVLFVEGEQLETITDRHYRSFCLPCAPFEERLKRDKR